MIDDTTTTAGPPGTTAKASAGELVGHLSEQLSTLVRDEMRLAQAELTAKGKKAGLGAGMFGGAGVVGLLAAGALVAAAILGLANAVPAWAAALIVAAVLLAVGGVLALGGKKEVSAATPPVPTEAMEGIRTDVRTVTEASRR